MPQKNLSGGIPRLFRSYTTRANEAADCKIWEAARATSAEPRFFKPIIIREESVSEAYVDGGLGHNNPIQLVLEEAKQVFHGRKVACIISVGAGQPGTISMPGSSRFHQITEAMQGIAADCEKSAEEVARHFQNIPDVYFRFNVEQGMQQVGLGQWERLDEVVTHTFQYLRNTHVDKLLDKAVAAVWKREGIVPTGRLGT